MKLAILGGGGFRTPFVWQALLRDRGFPRVTAVTLQDTSETRLAGMRTVLDQLAEGFDDPPRLSTTTDLDRALEGSDFVFAAVRVGGLAGRCADERVALDLGVLGQETTGPGGLAYALRTVPFVVDVAERVRRLAPHAHVLNFTNPAGITTEAMQAVLGDRVLGICDTPSGLGRRVALLLGHDPGHARFDYVGLNHLGWLRRVVVGGRDVLPDLLGDDGLLAQLEERHVFGAPWLKAFGNVPNEYLYYWYRNAEAVARIRAAALTRGEFLLRTQGEFFDRLPHAGSGAAQLWRETVLDRSASYMAEAKGGEQGAPENPEPPETDPSQQGYAGVALAVMAAIARDEPSTAILNVRNGSTVAGLPADAVVEVPVAVDGSGVRPFATDAPDLHQLGLMQQVKAVERHVIAAAVHGDRTEALLAFATHPLVRSADVAEKLLAGYVERIPEVAAVFDRR
ncbi:6-phospho-beta-glucosidase [Kineococcus radiotolerans]|uniref:Glycoside hydrolase family 4 n=1 Tax=Kineococcus radiotolerans (strain ATCC BAA-149 / DSM 14245 / SRS30216) TaxID=266940 RepID=A6W4L6_KINRD|nr:6-phospho-beta-glucosidase [Kineococcus radiotolerans]ABS01755.1 glycoside hydrolase family 4 [Kineococcus radiotolerans SRS30216 = ATCC BAA-149]